MNRTKKPVGFSEKELYASIDWEKQLHEFFPNEDIMEKVVTSVLNTPTQQEAVNLIKNLGIECLCAALKEYYGESEKNCPEEELATIEELLKLPRYQLMFISGFLHMAFVDKYGWACYEVAEDIDHISKIGQRIEQTCYKIDCEIKRPAVKKPRSGQCLHQGGPFG